MHSSLTLFQSADAMARHAADRMALTARNVANADTPAFEPKRLAPFAANEGMSFGLRKTHSHHLEASSHSYAQAMTLSSDTAPNGNSVSLEMETLEAISAKREHDQALALYRHGLTQLRNTLGR